jgi:polar amino acid transport system substrate-binding protein
MATNIEEGKRAAMAAHTIRQMKRTATLVARLKGRLSVPLVLVALLASVGTVAAQQAPDPRVAELVRAGRLRVALFLPQYTQDPVTGEIRGDVHFVETARALAARLGVELVLVGYPTPPSAVEGLRAGSCDVAFLGIEPSRAADVDFSPPVFELDYTVLVPSGSSIRSLADADQPGVRIAVVRNHASTLTLSRLLKHATLVYAETPDFTFDLLRTGRADAMASVADALDSYSTRLQGSRVLAGRYGFNRAALAVSKGQAGRLAYFSEFVEEAKVSGLLQRAIERGGLRGIHAAPAAKSGVQK